MAAKKKGFEDKLGEIDQIIEKLEKGELSLEDSIQEYEKAMALIKESEELLEEAEGKIMKVLEKSNGEIEIKEFE